MLEHYKDRDAFGKHMKSGHFSQWGPKLMNVMTSAPLRILAPAIQGTDMVKVIHHHAKPGTFAIVAEMNLRNSASRAEFEAVMREMMQETHKEPGILAYTLCQEAKGSSKLNEKVNEDLYYMVEVYGDYAAFSSHMKSGHYQKRGCQAKGRRQRRLHPLIIQLTLYTSRHSLAKARRAHQRRKHADSRSRLSGRI